MFDKHVKNAFRFNNVQCVCVCVRFLFSFSGLLYSQAFEWVNIDVNYLVSKQICCMQSHGHCNWIANKIKLLFDDIVKVAYTQNRLYDLQRFSGTKEIKKNVGLHFVPSCPIEMDCNKHATNVDNLTVWKHSKPFSIALSPHHLETLTILPITEQIDAEGKGKRDRDRELSCNVVGG